jgi:CheY-like chemotaxis protein
MKRLLIVDDELAIVEALQDILSLEGYDIATAYNGDEGLRQLLARKPDLVLLDLMMPVMDGGELLRRIRAHPDLHDLPVVVMSAGRLSDEERKASSHFLAKPFELDDLLGTLARQLPVAEAPRA